MKGTAKKITAALLLASLIAISFSIARTVLAANPPIRYYGYLTLGGSTAADGNNVSIWNGTSILGSALTPASASSGSGYYSVNIDAMHSGELLTFKANGVNATTPAPETVTAGAPGSSTSRDVTASSCTSHSNCSSQYCRYDGKCADKLANLANCSDQEYASLSDNDVCSGGYCYTDYSGGDEYCTNAATNCVSNQSGGVVAYANGSRSATSTYWCGVVTDGTWTFDIPPVVSVAADLYPDSPSTADALACKFTAHDDHAGLLANVTWYKNGAIQNALNQSQAALTNATNFDATNVSAALTNKTEVWTCNVTVYDTWGSTANTSDIVAIQNTAPAIGSPTLNTVTPYTNDTLTCTNGSFTDADMDTATWLYMWWKQEAGVGGYSLISGEGSSTLALTCSGCDKTDAIKCSTIASDGTANATGWTNASAATIQNYVPSIGSPTLNTVTPYTNDTLTCTNGSFTDADMDTATWLYMWWKQEAGVGGYSLISGEGSSTLALTCSGCDKTDAIKCSTIASDGTANATGWTNASAATIQNYIPGLPTHTLHSANGSTWTNNTLTAEFSLHDIDSSETYTLCVSPYKNATNQTSLHNCTAVLNATAINFTVAAASTSKNELWWFSALASDGTANSARTNTSAVYISNYIPSVSIVTDINGTNGSVYTNNTLAVVAKLYDIDADETYTFYANLYRNGSAVSQVSAAALNDTNKTYHVYPLAKNYAFSAGFLADDGQANSSETVSGTRYVNEIYRGLSLTSSPASRTALKNTAAAFYLNITNTGNRTETFNVSVNVTNTTLWNYTLSNTSANLTSLQSYIVNLTVIPNTNTTDGIYTILANATLYDPAEANPVYAAAYAAFNVTANATSGNSTNFTANQTTSINLTNETSVGMDIVTNTTVTGGTIDVTQTSSNPTNDSLDDTAGGKYVNVTGSTNVTGNLSYVILKIYYTDAELAYLGITNESTLTMYWYNGTSGEWVELTAGTPSWVIATGVNTTDNYVWANITHFSLFTFGGKKATGASCTAGGQCASGLCSYDYDSGGAWCVASGYCAHDATATTGSCGSSYRCPSAGGNWSYCSTGCSSNACITSSGGSGGGDTGGTGGGGGATRQLSIALDKNAIEITEGSSGSVTATVENKGSATENTVSVAVSGTGDATATVTPSTAASIASKKTKAFAITITVPDGAAAGERTLTVKADANGTAASATLKVTVKKKEVQAPSLETAVRDAIASAEAAVANADTQLSYYSQQGWKTSDAAASLSEAKAILGKSRAAMESKDFAAAKGMAEQATDKAGAALKMIVKPDEPKLVTDTLLLVILGLAVAAIVAAVFFAKRRKPKHHIIPPLKH